MKNKRISASGNTLQRIDASATLRIEYPQAGEIMETTNAKLADHLYRTYNGIMNADTPASAPAQRIN